MKRLRMTACVALMLFLCMRGACGDYVSLSADGETVQIVCDSAIAGEDYVFMMAAGRADRYEVTGDTLRRIRQMKADENGEIRVAAAAPAEEIVYLVCGPFADGVSPRVIGARTPDGTKLPSALGTIGKEAFMGTGFQAIYLSGQITSIGSAAFKNCTKLEYIEIPDSVAQIAPDAFAGCPETLVIGCGRDSAALSFALANNIRVELID